MAETLWDAVTDFLSPETGRRRRQALDEAVGNAIMGLLGPTGVPQRLGPVAEAVNPIAGMERAGAASQRVFDPSLDRAQRIGAAGDVLSEMAGAAAPGLLAARYGAPAASALQEVLLGYSQPLRAGAEDVAMRLNQPGQMPTLYSNPVVRAPDELPMPRNEAEAMARDILEMRAAGRAEDVTEEMMAAADPQYMYANTPLPMDYESRMARAREMGFDVGTPLYHGGSSNLREVSPFGGAAEAGQGGLFSTSSPRVANTYARPLSMADASMGGQNVTPLYGRTGDYRQTGYTAPFPADGTDAEISDWMSGLERFNRGLDADGAKPAYFKSQADAARAAGQPGVVIREVEDDRIAVGYALPSDVYMTLDPTSIRSRFARFDPEFRHLRNLSAGFGGLGLLALPQEDQQ